MGGGDAEGAAETTDKPDDCAVERAAGMPAARFHASVAAGLPEPTAA